MMTISGPPEEPQDNAVVDLDVGELPPGKDLRTQPSFVRERAAHKIAVTIVWIFGGAILGTLALDFLLILWFTYKGTAAEIEGLVSKGIVPLLTTTGTLISTVFGPLLAFILGYYFSQKHDRQDAILKRK